MGLLLLNNVENFAEGFRCEAFQDTRIEAERPTASQNFWWMGSWKAGRRSTFLSKNCVQRRSSFLAHMYVNKQNCRLWSVDQPEELQKLPMHPEKVTVWCGLWAEGIIRLHFLKDAANRNVTVNCEQLPLHKGSSSLFVSPNNFSEHECNWGS